MRWNDLTVDDSERRTEERTSGVVSYPSHNRSTEQVAPGENPAKPCYNTPTAIW